MANRASIRAKPVRSSIDRLERSVSDIDPKLAYDDVRARLAAMVNLILFQEQQAMALFRLYVTVGIALATVLSGAFLTAEPEALLPSRWGIATAGILIVIGAFACMMAMRPGDVALPGRGADFWLWALDGGTSDEVSVAYMQAQIERFASNRRLNQRNDRWLRWAKGMGLLAPIAAALVTAADHFELVNRLPI